MPNPTRATVLLAHGSSDPHWLQPFEQLLTGIRAGAAAQRVELAYMELARPALDEQIRALAAAGFTHIDMLPLFFAAGRHLRRDVPAQLAALQTELQAQGQPLQLQLHAPVGLEPEVAQAISHVVIRQLGQ